MLLEKSALYQHKIARTEYSATEIVSLRAHPGRNVYQASPNNTAAILIIFEYPGYKKLTYSAMLVKAVTDIHV